MKTKLEQPEEKQKPRRRATGQGLSFGPIVTAITVGTVAVLLGVTFIGDWLRIPKVTAEASPSIISPNADQAQDSTNFSYSLNEDAQVSVQVFDENNNLIQTLITNEVQTRGQHSVVWDGQTNLGQVAADGRYHLQVTARGTLRAGTQGVNVTVDTLPPTLRLANLDDTSHVREANFAVEGLTDPNAVIQLDGEPAVVPVDPEGRFDLKQQLVEGSNIIRVSASDPAGNVTTISHEVFLITQPPEVTITNPAAGASTNQSIISLTGLVPVGTLLKINGKDAVVAEDGQFGHEVILQEGENILRVEATDEVGNVTTQEMVIRRKTTSPALTLNVDEGETFQQSEIQIIGKTDPGAQILVGGQNVAVSLLGEFQTTVSLLNGDNLLDIVAQDQAGNTTQLQRRIRLDIVPLEPELVRVARNLPDLSTYFVPVLISLPVLLILAYFLTRPVTLIVSAESRDFQPGLPEEGHFLRLTIDLSKAARTSVEVKDKRDNTVATLLPARYRSSGQHSFYWDGYDDFGLVVLPGEYTVQARAGTSSSSVKGDLTISILEDPGVHRQHWRISSQDNANFTHRRVGEVVRTVAPRRK